MSFQSLALASPILRVLTEQGYASPTPVQLQSIPVILAGKDVLAGAQTGTGKTAAFTLPLLQQMLNAPKVVAANQVRVLVLTPTRELAQQVYDNVRKYSQYLNLRSAVFYGGVSIRPQYDEVALGLDILVATPGRLIDHLHQKTVDLSALDVLVLDEADRMLDMGFIVDIKRIMAKLPEKRQTLLFSATYSNEIKQLADELLNSPQLIEVAATNATAERVEQLAYLVDRHRKRELLSHVIGKNNWPQVLVFVRTKHGADRLAKQLAKDGLKCAAIHGDKSQGARRRAIADFKSAKLQVLIATEVAARGLDIQGLDYVVNFNLPYLPEDYVHRIGRTGRAGATGNAISFVSREEEQTLERIQKLIGSTVKRIVTPGFEVSNRESLLKSISRKVLSGRSNKASETSIDLDSANKVKPKAKPKAKPRIAK